MKTLQLIDSSTAYYHNRAESRRHRLDVATRLSLLDFISQDPNYAQNYDTMEVNARLLSYSTWHRPHIN